MQTLKKASSARRALALGLLGAAAAYVRARRVADGLDLRFASQPRPLLALVAAWLRAALLAPLHWLCQRLVAAKVRSALGIRGCVVSGGGSLATHLDDFYEAVGLPVLNGWGLSETSPVLACRRNLPGQNVRGSVGEAPPHEWAASCLPL
jgi:long-chain acyl-CoA synthetase